MSLNQSMNISVGSMKNNQYALVVVSQNIANMHVEGYHKQRVDFQTNEYTTSCNGVLSTIRGMNGAHIASLTNYIDDGAFRNKIDSNSDAQYYNTLADALGGLEDIADDLGDNGLNALLNDFYAAAADLEKFPTDLTIRQQYVSAAQVVCDKFNAISKKYDDVQLDTCQTVQNSVSTVNRLLEDLQQANVAHIKNHQGPSTQADINSILEELSNYTNITSDTNANGTVNVYIAGVKAVAGGELKYTLEADFNPNNPNEVVKFSLRSAENPDYVRDEGITEAFSTGALKAYVDFLNGSNGSFSNVNDMKKSLNDAAIAFADALNEIQLYESKDGKVFAASITTDSETGDLMLEKATDPFFTSANGDAIDAGNISVNPDIAKNPFLVSAARINLNNYENGEDWTKSVGNSDNAIEITALQNKKICSYGDGKNNATLSQFLTNAAAKSGYDLSSISKKADTYQNIADIDANNYANLIGVNLDEELADMIRYQRAFEASARIFSTVNDLLGTIIGMV